jgi:hypothetical protein
MHWRESQAGTDPAQPWVMTARTRRRRQGNRADAQAVVRVEDSLSALVPVVDDLHRMTASLDALLALSAQTRLQIAVGMADARRRDVPARSGARTPTDPPRSAA